MESKKGSIFKGNGKIEAFFTSPKAREEKFCRCPVCGSKLRMSDINHHLDSDCLKGSCEDQTKSKTELSDVGEQRTLSLKGRRRASKHSLTAVSRKQNDESLYERRVPRTAVHAHSIVSLTPVKGWRMKLNPYQEQATPHVIDLTCSENDDHCTSVTIGETGKGEKSCQSDVLCSVTCEGEESFPPLASDPNENDDNQECSANSEVFAEEKARVATLPDSLDSINDDSSNSVVYPPYYLANFKFIVSSMLHDSHNKHLFNEADLETAVAFESLDEISQKLYVRLYLRKHAWLRTSKIRYPLIGEDLLPVLELLVKKGFLYDESNLNDVRTALASLSATEVRSLASGYHLERKAGKALKTKTDFMAALVGITENRHSIMSFAKTGGTKSLNTKMLERAKSVLGKVVRVADGPRSMFLRIFALFGITQYNADDDEMNNSQSLVFRLLQFKRGDVIYPDYQINQTKPIFDARENLTDYTESLQLEDELDAILEGKQWPDAYNVYKVAKLKVDDILQSVQNAEIKMKCSSTRLPVYLRRFSAEWVYFRICGKSVEVIEKLGHYEEATQLLQELLSQTLYSTSTRGRYWERLALDTEKYLKNPRQALKHIQDALEDPFVRAGHRLALINRAKRICNSPKHKELKKLLSEMRLEDIPEPPQVTISGPMFLDTGSSARTIFITNDAENDGGQSYSAVEQFVIGHYKEEGYLEGVHAEGSTFSTLFGLMMWNILFLPRPDVFISLFQAAPLDLATDDFYLAREVEINRELQWIREASEMELGEKIDHAWTQHFGKACVGVNWELFESSEMLKGLALSLGPRVLAGVFEIFCKDYVHRCSGIPDLVVWNPETRKVKIVEVKGPGDRLSSKQIIWLAVFNSLGAEAEVCYVRAIAGKRRRLMTSWQEKPVASPP